MRHEIRLFFVALQFLTRVPVPAWVGFEEAWLNQCLRHFPLVGLCIGVFGAAATALALALFPPAVAVVLGMIATVWLTGAFHEDGLADTCDGLGGSVSRERALEIMKDSRIGAYGAIGLMLSLGLKAAVLMALVEIHPALACAALAWTHAASRLAPLCAMARLPYAGDAAHAKAKPMATQIGGTSLGAALAWSGLISVAAWVGTDWLGFGEVAGSALLAATGALVAAALGMTGWLRRRLGGYTGDTLGATQQIAELACLLAWLAVLHG